MEHPESVAAIAVHEFGHALMHARGENGNGIVIVLSMVGALWIGLIFWTATWREILIAGVAAAVLLGSTALQNSLGYPAALLWLIVIAGVVVASGKSQPPRRRLAVTLGSLAAVTMFMWPAMDHHRHEIFSDVVAACADGDARWIKDGLLHVSNQEGWSRQAASILFDPTHPNIQERVSTLDHIDLSGKQPDICVRLKGDMTTKDLIQSIEH